MPPAGEEHGDARSVAGGDRFLVALAAAGLDDADDARSDQCIGAVTEREERVTRRDRTARTILPACIGFGDGDLA